MFKQIAQVVNETGVNNVSGQFVHLHIIQIKKGDKTDAQKKAQSMQISLSSKDGIEAKNKIQKVIQEVKSKHKSQIPINIQQKKGPGEEFGDYGQIPKILEEGSAKLASKEGQVLLVDVWATWCGPCQKPMQHNQDMLQKNKWGQKVRIVGVSVDDDKNTIKQRIQSRGWKSIQHLGMGKWDHEHPLIKDFKIQGIPFVCLVDTKGVINYVGHPMSINLEQRINELIAEKSQGAVEEIKTNKQSLDDKIIQELLNTFSNQGWMDKQFEGAQVLSMKLEVKSFLKDYKIRNEASIKVYVTSRDQQLLAKFQKMVPAGVKLQKKIIEQVQVPPTQPKCRKCEKQLQYPLYWCKWNDNEFRCQECVHKKDQQKYWDFINNSILLTSPIKLIPKANLGKNIQPTQMKDVEEPNLFGCNVCGQCPEQIGSARYICLHCRSEPNYYGDFVDVCENCIKKYLSGDQQTKQKLNVDGHKMEHSFLRVLFNVKGYYEF